MVADAKQPYQAEAEQLLNSVFPNYLMEMTYDRIVSVLDTDRDCDCNTRLSADPLSSNVDIRYLPLQDFDELSWVGHPTTVSTDKHHLFRFSSCTYFDSTDWEVALNQAYPYQSVVDHLRLFNQEF